MTGKVKYAKFGSKFFTLSGLLAAPKQTSGYEPSRHHLGFTFAS